MKKIAVICALLVVAIIGFMSFQGGTGLSPTGNMIVDVEAAESINGNVQKATLKMVNYGYVVEPSPLQVGVPVEMTVDLSTVTGCMRDVVISSFGVRKYVSEGDNVITFTPDKEGTFPIVCSMNMGRGSFVVGAADANAGEIETQNANLGGSATAGGSCGGAGGNGGCGCGGGI